MKRSLTMLSVAAGIAWAQTSLAPPQAGFMRDAVDSLRPVYGIAGNFLLGSQVTGAVQSAAYSGSFGLVKSSSAVSAIDGTGSIAATSATPDGPALFAFRRNGEPALVYLLSANTLLVWNAGAFEPVPFDPATLGATAVLSVAAPLDGHAAMIVQRDDGLWDVRIELATGAVDSQTAIPGISAPVLMLANGQLVYGDQNGIVLRASNASERHIGAELPASFEFEQMDRDWIQLRDLGGGRQFAIRITENHEQFYRLPEAGQ